MAIINQGSFPDSIDVVLGPAWTGSNGLSEDDMLTLTKSSTGTNQVDYTEDGSTTANPTTNRIKATMMAPGTASVSYRGSLYAYYATGTDFSPIRFFYTGAVSPIYNSTIGTASPFSYTFREVWIENGQYESQSTITVTNDGWPKVFKSMVESVFSASHTASGGLTLGGLAVSEFLLEFQLSGGLTIGGSSDFQSKLPHQSIGGLTIGGESSSANDYNFVVTGGLSLSGNADIGATSFATIANGGIVISGEANVTVGYEYAVSGGVNIGGQAVSLFLFSYLSSGGLVLGEGSTNVINVVLTSDGGISTGGVANAVSDFIYVVSGGLTVGGESSFSEFNFHIGTGGIVLDGESENTVIFEGIVSGALVLSGDSLFSGTNSHVSNGGVMLNGNAGVFVSYIDFYDGGISLNNDAGADFALSFTSSGDLNIVGESIFAVGYNHSPEGSLTISGEAVSFPPQVGEGGIVLNEGVGIPNFTLPHIATGGLVVNGSGEINFLLPHTITGGFTVGGNVEDEVVDYNYDIVGEIALGSNSVAEAGYIYETPVLQIVIGGVSGVETRYTYEVVVTPWAIAGKAGEDLRLFHIATGGLALGGAADAEIRDFKYIPRAGLILFGITEDVTLSVSQYFFEVDRFESRLRIRGDSKHRECEITEGSGVPCNADCNDDVTMVAFFAEPKPIIRDASAGPETAAFVPAITVCNQNLWQPCPSQKVVNKFESDLRRRSCITKRFNTKR